jgi:hypothetical protein
MVSPWFDYFEPCNCCCILAIDRPQGLARPIRIQARWLKAVLIPEADRAGIRLGWLLAVLEGSGPWKGGEDELASLRQLAPAIRAELAASGKAVDEAGFAFGALPRAIS